MVVQKIEHLADYILTFLRIRLEGKHANDFLIALAITFVSLFFAFPSYDITYAPEMSENWNAILEQQKNPFSHVEYHPGSHAANLAYRLTPILIGRIFGVETITGYLILQVLALYLFFVLVLKIFFKITNDKTCSVTLLIGVAFTFFGNVLCSDYRGFFDVFAFLFLSAAMLSNQSLLIAVALLLAYFTDERALIASSLVFLFFTVQSHADIRSINFQSFFKFSAKHLALISSWIVYFLIRFLIAQQFDLRTNAKGMFEYLLHETIHQVNILPFGLWTALEGFWLLIFASLIIIATNKTTAFAILYFFALGVVAFIGIWVFDVTRSLAYLLPAVMISLILVARSETIGTLRYIALAVAGICIFPTYYAGGPEQIMWLYPLPIQLLRMVG